jgi:hypothetical protein
MPRCLAKHALFSPDTYARMISRKVGGGQQQFAVSDEEKRTGYVRGRRLVGKGPPGKRAGLSNTMGREWKYKRTGKEKKRALARTVVEHSIGFRGALCCFCTVLLNLEPIINPDGEH